MNIELTVSLVLEFLAAWFAVSLFLVTLLAVAGSRLRQQRPSGSRPAPAAAARAEAQGHRETSLALIA